ncbi:unnamed protein product [Rotaria magnacalcarata]|uniref:Protein kinase domain-containing protein n=1 Tax=Rotaria magnacalcarata TaxID=392030 RepID=A0A8S2IPV3_9BILA|nr:unnamed protein product [Rotaria magnacalcarata]CAF3794658.1 unnamed protein product [Rotaria magnacalcarata]CAF3798543.1 unnamed protein product [Rotaria magnacalcarata]
MTSNSESQGEWYTTDCGRTQFTLPVRYQNLVHIGYGASGTVIRATDTETGKYVAIKKIFHPFRSQMHAKQTYQRLKQLMYLNHPDAQVVQLYNVFTPEKNIDDFQTLYFVLNYVDYDLSRVIKRNVPFTEDQIKYIIYSLLRGLKFIHSAGIFHHELNPSDIGMDKNTNIAFFERGLMHRTLDPEIRSHIQCRWGRAPETALCERYNGDKIDIWSTGCIMAELILLRPIFRGTDLLDQFDKIFDIIGTPDLAILNDIFIPITKTLTSGVSPEGTSREINHFHLFKVLTGIDFLDCLLTFDHRTRPTAEEALSHPFLKTFHDTMYEPTKEFLFDEHQAKVYSTAEWKSIIWQMIEEFVPPSWINDEDDIADD